MEDGPFQVQSTDCAETGPPPAASSLDAQAIAIRSKTGRYIAFGALHSLHSQEVKVFFAWHFGQTQGDPMIVCPRDLSGASLSDGSFCSSRFSSVMVSPPSHPSMRLCPIPYCDKTSAESQPTGRGRNGLPRASLIRKTTLRKTRRPLGQSRFPVRSVPGGKPHLQKSRLRPLPVCRRNEYRVRP